MNGQTGVIVVHNRSDTRDYLAGCLKSEGFRVYPYKSGPAFLRAWANPSFPIDADAIFIHKDIVEAKESMDVAELVRTLRDRGGAPLRTVLVSGEYAYGGVRTESVRMGADVGYDCSDIDNDRGALTSWVVGQLHLGKVSETEARQFRGRSIVENASQAVTRSAFVEGTAFRGKER